MELRSSAAFSVVDFQSLFESSPDPYLVLTRNLVIAAVNDAYLRATMTQRRSIVGRELFEVFPDNPADPGATGVGNLRESLERVLSQRTADAMAVQKYDIRQPTSEGGGFIERFWSPVNSPVLDGDGEVLWIIHRVEDVTEFVRLKKEEGEISRQAEDLRQRTAQMEREIFLRAQQLQEANTQLREQNERLQRMASELALAAELRRSQALLQAVVDSTAASIHVKDVEGRYLLVNRRFEELREQRREYVVGRCDQDLMPAEHALRAQVQDREVLDTGMPIEFEQEVFHGGARLTLSGSKFPLFDLDRRVYATCTVAADVTESRRLEERLRQAQKMEAIGQLAGGVAHDFNNVLTAIFGYANVLDKALDARPDLRQYVAQILRGADRAATLTRQLLAFSRGQTLRPWVVGFNTIVDGIVPMLRQLIGEDVELVTSLHPDCGRALVDPGKIEQVIVNLVVNARDAMAAGGTLCLETANIDLNAVDAKLHPDACPGPYILLAVSDTGHGMDAETRSHIFEPFFTTKEEGKGTGLGLSTVYGIVRQSGGHIDVYSEPGHGTIFKVYVPRVSSPTGHAAASAADAPDAASAADALSARPSSSGTILVVEDDEILRTLITLLLEKAGFEVLCVSSPADALTYADDRRKTIDLLLTDVVMPGLSGPELVSRLAALGLTPRVLYMSGYTADVVTRRSLLPADVQFVEKPFTEAQLLSKIDGAMSAPQR